VTWRRHFVYRKESLRTTWKLRLAALAVLLLAGLLTRGFWEGWIGRSLVCARDVAPSDLALVENFDPQYLLFERAEELERRGLAPRTLVPVQVSAHRPGAPNPVSRGIAEVMARQARIREWDVVPIHETEPVSLNAALQLRERLAAERVTSIVVLAPGFRSRRSALVYEAVLPGVRVRCEPVFGQVTPERWTRTWHGVQEVALEQVKLQYYRLYVLPFLAPRGR
jgi:hypothetical protein